MNRRQHFEFMEAASNPFPQPKFSKFFYLLTRLGVFFSLSVCCGISWLRYEQAAVMTSSEKMLEKINQARVDLAKGFLYVTLAEGAQTSFRREEGLALIDQAITLLEETNLPLQAGTNNSHQKVHSHATFDKAVTTFRAELSQWNQAPSGVHEDLRLHLRLLFHESE